VEVQMIRPTSNAEQFCEESQGGQYKCAHLTKFCTGLYEKQKDLLRTEQHCVSRTTIKVYNTTDTRLDCPGRFIAS